MARFIKEKLQISDVEIKEKLQTPDIETVAAADNVKDELQQIARSSMLGALKENDSMFTLLWHDHGAWPYRGDRVGVDHGYTVDI